VPFEDVNVMENVEARQELVRLTGRMAVPVIVVGGEIVVGFDRARLQALLTTL
jgi:glutaredoxin